ncbi:MmcQ/YjbR family DNA-binding protein [Kaistia dalseonensis]|uniref:MmcQ/YjbR family DNA-binding protein n=1 Tax=Kaistia dalseonensis TaxID=410840 RepID=A0ABU0H6C3_9HYPH|nr:MmcQ/YjbR family DNA-binding protein [Kaistia dalseonensis]MCX5495268.1 MmcQ/YjbR family DNA-binding protein [Kaistia dalseonensis]MDQ0437854.1 hypothetical protein [Kaistia dalseonensis]
MPVTVDDLRGLFLRLPDTREGLAHGTIAFYVGKKFLGRFRDDDTVFAMPVGFDERDMLITIEPEVFFTLDHYRGYPYVLIRLAETTPERLEPIVMRCWRSHAPRRVLKAFDAGKTNET